MANESHLQIEKFVHQSGLQPLEKQALGFYTRAALPNRIIADTDQTVIGTVLANSGLSLVRNTHHRAGTALVGGNNYTVAGSLLCLATNTNGIKIDLGGGTATIGAGSTINYKLLTATTVAASNVTSLTTTASATTVIIKVDIEGYLKCTNSGSLILRFAEQANSTGVVVYAGSWLETMRTY